MKAAGQKAHAHYPETPRLRALDFREAFLDAVTPEDVAAVGKKLLELARAGDIRAASLLLDRVLGSEAVSAWDSRESATRQAIMLGSL